MGAVENYKKRVTGAIGSNLKEYVKTQVRSTLDTFLTSSQYGMDVTINDQIERIGIMTGGMSDTKDEVKVLSEPNVLKMGTLFEWEGDFWIVVKREVRVIKESFYGIAYRCNIDLKWVNKDGVLTSQKGYAKGRGLSSVLVEESYADAPVIARNVDTPITAITQFNKELEQEMRFLFAGQPYRVTFVDNLSIDGTTILGMYDDILQDGDDVENNVANYKKKYTIETSFNEEDVVLEVNKPFAVEYEVLLNGEVTERKDIVIKVNPEEAIVDGNTITPIIEGDISVTLCLAQNELIETSFVIHTGAEWTTENIFIVGPDSIAWNKKSTYKLNNGKDAEFVVTYPSKVKGHTTTTTSSVEISIEDKYSGTINLVVMTEDGIYTKDIEIVSMEV